MEWRSFHFEPRSFRCLFGCFFVGCAVAKDFLPRSLIANRAIFLPLPSLHCFNSRDRLPSSLPPLYIMKKRALCKNGWQLQDAFPESFVTAPQVTACISAINFSKVRASRMFVCTYLPGPILFQNPYGEGCQIS